MTDELISRQMTLEERAVQFSAFAALSGYDEEKWVPATEEDYNMWLDRATEQFLKGT